MVLLVALSRFLFRSRYLYDVDSVNFALALRHFDPAVYQPHPPGYFLYICLGRLAQLLFPDANTALVAVSIAASCGAAVMIYLLTDMWFGKRAALCSGLIFVFSPLVWFHGTVALTYVVEAFFSALIGYLSWRCFSGETAYLAPAALAFAAAAGFRQTSALLLAPVWLASIRHASKHQVTLTLGIAFTGGLAWFIPMVHAAGGMQAYFGPLMHLWTLVLAKHSTSSPAFALWIARVFTIAAVVVLVFGSASWLPFAIRRGSADGLKDKRLFTWIWIAPGLLFFVFVFFLLVNSGYILVLTPPGFAWLGKWGSDWYDGARLPSAAKIAAVGALAATNALVFVYAPAYCSYKSVRRFEAELTAVNSSLRELVSPHETMIVGFDSHFLGYRHAAYYLPDFLTVQFPEVEFPSGKRVFIVRDRSTSVVSRVPADGILSFVLYPLPADAEYQPYAREVAARFPPGALRIATAGGRQFLTGSAADLTFLFPHAVATPDKRY
jgi:hypothetical protein